MSRTERKLILIVSIWLKTGNGSDFEAYERRVARLLEKHSGRIERTVRIEKEVGDEEAPFEIHVVVFPGEKKFADYLEDAETRKLAKSREQIIARTEVLRGFDPELYHG